MNSDDATAERLRKLSRYLSEKNKCLEALLQRFTRNPTWPIEAMVREYSAVLDATDGREYMEQVRRDASADGLDYRQRSARTKRVRTRERLVLAATELVLTGDTDGDLVARTAKLAGLSPATGYNHFNTRNDLLWAVYDRLLHPQTTEGN
jgi:hypothetical protein